MTIFEEILGLLSGSPELHAYLLARPEQLQTTDYADIITGAPVRAYDTQRRRQSDSGLQRLFAHGAAGAGKQGCCVFGGALEGRRTA